FMDGFPIRDLPPVTPWHLMPFGRGRPHHHCERSEAIKRTSGPYVPLDCFVANAPRNADSKSEQLSLTWGPAWLRDGRANGDDAAKV
ncbi:MAG: hypothetical protein WB766_15690, partial [Roseiarcus sp.]